MKFDYICSECGNIYDIRPDLMVCPDCAESQIENQPLAGVLEVRLTGEANSSFDLFDLLPVEREFFPPSPVGNTPLWEPENIRRRTGFKNLYIKDDGANPTNSFKDRASYLVSAFAKKNGINNIVLASTGNAGSSMAGIGAAAGQKITIFLPETAPPAKIIQALQYGADVHKVAGNYDLAYDFSMEYSKRAGGMNRNTAYNPMTIEGKKTVSLEVFRQLGKAPDYVFVSTGDGCILGGIYKGFEDLKKLGIINRIPVIYSVQAEGSDALYRAFHEGKFTNLPTSTIADSICVDVPRNGVHALNKLKTHSGRITKVSDDQIIEAQSDLSATAGLFTEPAGSTAWAGFKQVAGDIEKDAVIVIMATGNGLKDTATALKGIHMPEKSISSVDEVL
ncbi:MAG: pyridoxal-phosphate dependent enzyme [Spirochaetaceae bacterium]|jgi:threonine synthase|nr:pyridoxal-phosphate dependent enzyme [Spirochaetaceae bacterium]